MTPIPSFGILPLKVKGGCAINDTYRGGGVRRSGGRDSVEPQFDFWGSSHGSTESRPSGTNYIRPSVRSSAFRRSPRLKPELQTTSPNLVRARQSLARFCGAGSPLPAGGTRRGGSGSGIARGREEVRTICRSGLRSKLELLSFQRKRKVIRILDSLP